MSGTAITSAPARPPRALAGARGPERAAVAIVAALTLLALALRLYQLARPGYLLGVTEYDDAVDFGSAVRLVHGQLPYRDFVLVQPPGISLLMAPVALITRGLGTGTGLAVARVLTACAGAGGVVLAGALVRHRGALATVLTCGLLAVFPASVQAAHTVLLEPWLVLFCLIGAVLVFAGDELATSHRRLFWGGAAFGFAGAIKVWAVLAVLAVLVVGLRRLAWRPWLIYLGGVAAGFGLAVLPFALLAPASFYRSVVVAQLSRVDLTRVRIVQRLLTLTGLSDFSPVSHPVVIALAAAVAGVVVVCLAGAALRTHRPAPPTLESFALLSAALVLAAFLWPADYYSHYAAFLIPFLALSIALPAERMLAAPTPAHRPARLASLVAVAAGIVLVAAAAVRFDREAKLHAGDPAAAAQRQIPAGACVLTDLPALAIVSDRFTSSAPGCSAMIDPIGTDYALSHGRNGVSGAGRFTAVRRVWLSAFAHAQYVWISCAPAAARHCRRWTNRRIPWTAAILGYFHAHFVPVPGSGRVAHVFVRRQLRATIPGSHAG